MQPIGNQLADTYTVVIPARNEAGSLARLLPTLAQLVPQGVEIIVVNDGSDDDTLKVCELHGVRVLSHPYPKGNGAAIKTGARSAKGNVLIFMMPTVSTSPKTSLHCWPSLPRVTTW
jgi:glycosyltransferase involved in cell wall biosynthesis